MLIQSSVLPPVTISDPPLASLLCLLLQFPPPAPSPCSVSGLPVSLPPGSGAAGVTADDMKRERFARPVAAVQDARQYKCRVRRCPAPDPFGSLKGRQRGKVWAN